MACPDHASSRPARRSLLPFLTAVLALGVAACGDGGVDEEGAVSRGTLTTITAADGRGATVGASAPASPGEEETGATGGTGASGASGTTGSGATLTAGGAALLDGDADAIADHVGEDADGSGLEVLSVAKSGFFVGSSEADRQYVEFGGDVGDDESDQVQPKVGDVVTLTGPVRPAPADPGETLDLEDADAMLVEDRGAYINASRVTPAG
jgi:hypothetical protein